MRVRFGTKEITGYTASPGETYGEILDKLCELNDLEVPAHVTVTVDWNGDIAEKNIDDVPSHADETVVYRAVAAKKGC